MFKKKRVVLIAISVLLLGIVLLVSFTAGKSWKPIYNSHSHHGTMVSRMEPAGSIYETLTEEQLALVTPTEALQGMSFTNRCHYWVSGTQMQVYLLHFYFETDWGKEIRVSIGEEAHEALCCIFFDADAVISKCGNFEYVLYESNLSNVTNKTLFAKAYINDVPVVVFMSGIENVKCAKRDFEKVLEWLTSYRNGYPKIDELTPINGPENVINQTLNLEDAQSDPTFGQFMVRDEPEGLSLHRITRSKYGTINGLDGCWMDGFKLLDWHISVANQRHMENLIPVRSELYAQLSDYPPVDNGMVPEHLEKYLRCPYYFADELTLDMVQARAVTYDDPGLQYICFGVLAGDIAIRIDSRGVEPEWIYEQIVQIRDNLE